MNFDLGANLDHPSYFEVAAQERVIPALFAAFEHALTVVAARHPSALLRIHNLRDEAFFLLLLLIERQCLHSSDASMAEHLFSLRRAPISRHPDMTPNHRRLSLLFLVALPYVRAKLQRLCSPPLDQQEGGDGLEAVDAMGGGGDGNAFSVPVEARRWAVMETFFPSTSNRPPQGMEVGRTRSWKEVIAAVYPFVHAGIELSVLVYHILYLFERTRHSSPWLRALKLELKRATQDDFVRMAERVQRSRASRMAWAGAQPLPLRLLFSLAFKSWHVLNDNFKVTLFGLALVFKLADWWYTSSDRDASTSTAVILPPPPRPQRAAGGLRLPPKKGVLLGL